MLETLRHHIATRLQRLSVRLQRTGTVKALPKKKGHKTMRRPWKVPLQKNRKLQSCLAMSLALHLLVIFGITHRDQVAQFPVLSPINAVALDDPQLLQVPFVLLTASGHFEFTEAETANLGAYLTSGGFLFAEIVSELRPSYSDTELDIPAVRSLIRTSLQAAGYQEWKDWQFRRLAMTHPIYHCFYDVGSLPRGMRDMHYAVGVPLTPNYLEGIVVGDQLVGVYSMRGYADFWAGMAEQEAETFDVINSPFLASAEEPMVYNLGVNFLVYALTREGSLAQQLVAAD